MSEIINLYNPLNFVCGDHVLLDIGKYIETFGTRAFLIESPQSKNAAGKLVQTVLEDAGIVTISSKLFSGSPSKENAELYIQSASAADADIVIAIGGGKVSDTAKYAASELKLPLITVPTISATNASYRRNSIVYTKEGAFVDAHVNRQSPIAVLADTEILAKQPIRYVQSGIIDTLVRKYEAQPYEKHLSADFHFRFSYQLAQTAYQFFEDYGDKINADFEKQISSKLVRETITNIIGICGIAANYSSDTVLQGFAHPFYNQLTRVNPKRELLHGEIVGYGILVQLLLEKKSREELAHEFALLQKFGFAYSLSDIGITSESKLKELVSRLWEEDVPRIFFTQNLSDPSILRDAILKVDDWVHQKNVEA